MSKRAKQEPAVEVLRTDDPDPIDSDQELKQQILTKTDDRLFRTMLQIESFAADALRELLPAKVVDMLDFSRIRIEPTDFCDDELRAREADCIFLIPVKRKNENDPEDLFEVQIILEHKSVLPVRKRAEVIVQVLKYAYGLCERQTKKSEDITGGEQEETGATDDSATTASDYSPERPLCQPFVVVVYTGEDRNLVSLKMSDIFKLPPGFEEYSMNFPAHFVNVTRLREVEGYSSLNAFLEVMFRIMTVHSAGELTAMEANTLDPLREIIQSAGLSEFDKKCVDMLLTAFCRRLILYKIPNRREHMQNLLGSAAKKEGRYVMTTALLDKVIGWVAEQAWYEKGRDEGRVEGRVEGRDSQYRSFRNAVVRRFGNVPNSLNESVRQITDLELLEELVDFTSFDARSVRDVQDRIAEMIG